MRMMMRVLLDEEIKIPIDQELDVDFYRTKYTYDNPQWSEARRLGYSIYKIPRHIRLWQQNGAFYTLPRGLIGGLGVSKLTDQTITRHALLPASNIQLRQYQKPAVQRLLVKNQGVIVALCGAGKTIFFIEVMTLRKQWTLIIVHTLDLLEQWKQLLKTFANIDAGVIHQGRWEIKSVTIALVQSLFSRMTKEFANIWGLVIVDECAHAPARTFFEVINQFPARYRFGCTAVPVRRDGLEFLMHALLGNVIYNIRAEDLLSSGQIMRPSVKPIYTGVIGNFDNYTLMIESLISNKSRNQLILKHISREVLDHWCLVLSERIKHSEILHQILMERYPELPAACISSRSSKEQRNRALKDFSDGKIRVLFATKLAEEALDLPRADRLFLTCPIRSVSKVTQMTGRVMRCFPGKESAVIYDFVDEIPLARSQWQTRKRRVYKDYEIVS
jgi:superfamily II DNA or RNA helicase